MELQDRNLIREISRMVLPEEEIHSIRRLGGLTNRTYRVRAGARSYVFRLPGTGTKEIIDRRQEQISTELACRLGIDAALLFFDADTGVKVSAYLPHAETMSPETMRREENLRLAARILRRLHDCGEDTGVVFDVFGLAAGYEKVIRRAGGSFYPDYAETRRRVMAVRDAMQGGSVQMVPCHNDPLCENWLRTPDRMYLVDWEYAGMNDAMWDLADLAIEARLDRRGEELLFRSYWNGDIPAGMVHRFDANRIFLDFLWCLWGKTRAPFDETMETYAAERYGRLKRNLEQLGQR